MRIAGWIVAGDDQTMCHLLAVEEGVAVLELGREKKLPSSFTLEIPGNLTVRRTCSVVTQDGRIVRAVLWPPARATWV